MNPFDRRAPEFAWEALSERLRGAEFFSSSDVEGVSAEREILWIATQLTMYLPASLTSSPDARVEPKLQVAVQHAGAAA